MKRATKAALLSWIFLIGFFAFFWPGAGRAWIDIDINSGTSAHQVASALREKGLIKTPYLFLGWLKIRRGENQIKPGRYRFSRGRSAFWIAGDLIEGRTQKVRLTIPEGFASWQIAERLETLRICPALPFKEVVAKEELEGFLFPATYELDVGFDARHAALFLKDQFDKRWTPEMEARAQELKLTKRDVVTLASIIEREVMVRDELPLVSAVYHNRLKRKMPLQADPTVQYAMGFWKRRLTYDDYRKTISPYNTYLHAGLPPGPICSPGLDAINAALWPASSDALYLLAAEEGRHTFSTNYRDHTNKVNKRNRTNRQKR